MNILFCLTGTGKTRTLVCAILELTSKIDNFILVCAQTNAACDEITERLLDASANISLFRLYARAQSEGKIPSKIRPVSNYKNGQCLFPSLQFLYKFRVIVCTLLTAGSLTRAREIDVHFDSCHFTHVFIDEAACHPEPVSMIPIAGT